MMSRLHYRGICCALLLVLLSTVVPPLSAQESPSDPVLDLMAQMSPEAKVGQLVIVTFAGTDIGPASEIVSLIRDYQIGGVLLRPGNGNLTSLSTDSASGSSATGAAPGISAGELISITNRLQTIAWDSANVAATPIVEDDTILPASSPYVPLLIGMASAENGIAPMSLIAGTSPLPTPLALGATWDPSFSETVGAVLGREMSALGINLYLGPDLDILYTPRPGDPADLGTQVFGGDPYWVGEMGTAHIRGLHEGSAGRLLVVPRHLPGLGSADRPLEEEVPTVQKPLEMLKQIELVPFFAAAQELPGAETAADGFLVTHIRYRGFQGDNVRQTTRPISLDATALKLVVTLDEFEPWRAAGGLLIADNLGLQSVRLSYDPRGLTFNARRVAQDALSAGNDLLVLDRFGASDSWDLHFANVRDTLMFFTSRYKDEPAFQALVDAAVYRILKTKFGLYERNHIDAVLVDPAESSGSIGGGELVNAQVALSALTLVFPLSEDLLPSPPQEGQTLVVFTQERAFRVNDAEDVVVPLRADAIADALMRFYGPDGTGVVRFDAIQAFTFEDLRLALEFSGATDEDGTPLPLPLAVNRALNGADWVLFATNGLVSESADAMALKQFLATQANVIDGHLAVLAFGPPYELDSTEISKLDAYYALYSTGEAFVEAGVRALFRDLVAPGDSPVDVPALNYFMPQETMPSPEQTLSLAVVDEAGEELTATAKSDIHIGDVINLRTGVILDRNAHVVPDGTPVQFVLNYPQEGVQHKIVGETLDGVAQAAVTLDRAGQLDITVQSEPATSSVKLELVSRDDGVTITEVEPTPTLTPTTTPTATPEPTATPTPDPVPHKEVQLPDPPLLPTVQRAELIRWGLLGAFIVAIVGFLWSRQLSLRAEYAIRVGLVGLVGGLAGYDLFVALGRWWLPVVHYVLIQQEYIAAAVAAGVGGLVVLVTLWAMQDRSRYDPTLARRADRRYLKSRV